jgi:hypothetical protein
MSRNSKEIHTARDGSFRFGDFDHSPADGQLEESAAAHQRAIALDPAMVTSVPHTHFLRGNYQATLDTYAATRYYLDAAAWAALGDTTRAASLLRDSPRRWAVVSIDGRPDDLAPRDPRGPA